MLTPGIHCTCYLSYVLEVHFHGGQLPNYVLFSSCEVWRIYLRGIIFSLIALRKWPNRLLNCRYVCQALFWCLKGMKSSNCLSMAFRRVHFIWASEGLYFALNTILFLALQGLASFILTKYLQGLLTVILHTKYLGRENGISFKLDFIFFSSFTVYSIYKI